MKNIKSNMEIYEPREDSFFLEKIVKRKARGDVLDMGTGTGIQARAAKVAMLTNSVTAADINPNAENFLKDNSLNHSSKINANGIRFIHSNLFENIPTENKYDTIIFNPPYLPDMNEEGYVKDIALDGGPEGIETTVEFLKQAKSHLKEKGMIIILVSSTAKVKKLNETIHNLGYAYRITDRTTFDFETLFCYEIKHK